MTWVLLLACAGDSEDASEGVHVPVLPELRVDVPERGAFLGSDDTLVLRGRAIAGDARLTELWVDDERVELDDQGNFATELSCDPGLRVIGVRVVDADGERAVDGRSVLCGADHGANSVIEGAVRMRLGPSVLDDDAPDVDDVAAMVELLASDPTLTQDLIGQEFESSGATVTLTGLELGPMAVDLEPTRDLLQGQATVSDLVLDFDVSFWLSTSGTVWIDTLVIDLDLVPTGGTGIDVRNVDATINGMTMEIEWVPGWVESLLDGWVRSTLEEQLADTLAGAAGGLIETLAGSFATTLDVADGVSLSLELAEIDVSRQGLLLELDAGVLSTHGVPNDAGSADQTKLSQAFPLDDGAAPFAVAVDGDLVDQLMFGMWSAGALDQSFSGTELAVLAGKPLPPPLGPVESASLTFGLPPSLGPGDADHGMVLGLGELALGLVREDGEQLTASLNVLTQGDLTLADGAVSIDLDAVPRNMRVEVGMLAAPSALDPGDLASLFRLMTPSILASAGNFAPSIDLPPLPLDALSDAPELEGKALVPTDATLTFSEQGWLILAGDLAAR